MGALARKFHPGCKSIKALNQHQCYDFFLEMIYGISIEFHADKLTKFNFLNHAFNKIFCVDPYNRAQ